MTRKNNQKGIQDARKCGNKMYLALPLHQGLSQLYDSDSRGTELNRKTRIHNSVWFWKTEVKICGHETWKSLFSWGHLTKVSRLFPFSLSPTPSYPPQTHTHILVHISNYVWNGYLEFFASKHYSVSGFWS